jgi:hypothetical protein
MNKAAGSRTDEEEGPEAIADSSTLSSDDHGLDRCRLFSYRVPSEPSRARVGVWRELRRLGACYIQQAVCVLPDRPGVDEALARVRERVEKAEGTCFQAVLTDLDASGVAQLFEGFTKNSERDYAEIVEECETKFYTEIDYERGRENYTFEEAEEIREDLEKIRRWLSRVEARDWMKAPGRLRVLECLNECQSRFDAFEDEVFARSRE